MAPGHRLPSLVILVFMFVYQANSEYCVVPTPDSDCACLDLCITIDELSSNVSSLDDSNLTLTFQPGSYWLSLNLSISNLTSLKMYSNTVSTRIICDPSAGIRIIGVNSIAIHGLNFVSCENIEIVRADSLSLLESTFMSDGTDSVALVLRAIITAHISNCSFAGTGIRVLEQSFATLDSTTISGRRSVLSHAALVVHSSNVLLTGFTRFLDGDRSLFVYNATVNFSDNTEFHNCSSIVSGVPFAEDGGAIFSHLSHLIFQGTTTFTNNSAKYGGALFAKETSIVLHVSVEDSILPYTVPSIVISNNTATIDGGGIYLYRSTFTVRGQCNVTDNTAVENGGGIYAMYSDINVEPPSSLKQYTLIFIRNSAMFGGGLHLEGASRLHVFISNNSIQFIGNIGDLGGAIYVEDNTMYRTCLASDDSATAVSECFLQAKSPYQLTEAMPDIETDVYSVVFNSNVANMGPNLFGGLLDRCIPPSFDEGSLDLEGQHDGQGFDGLTYFKRISNINSFNESGIASHPTKMCACEGDKPNCTVQSLSITNVQKGDVFNLSMTAVDQTNHPTKANIISYPTSSRGVVDREDVNDDAGTSTCTNLSISVRSPSDNEVLHFYVDGPCHDTGMSRLIVSVNFSPCVCPSGFQHSATNALKNTCECTCDELLADYVDDCNEPYVLRRRNSWVQYINDSKTNQTSYTIGPICPFSFCGGDREILLNTSNTDAQCIEDRSGTLCIECSGNRSLALSGKRCIHCPELWPLITIATLLGAMLIGIGLVIAIMALNFTVSVGTINGFIFYVNILDVFDMIFLPFGSFSFPELIIEWLNLDPGLDICFVPGYSLYPHVWVRLSFPLYIIFIVVAIIIISGRSVRFSKLIGKRNPIAVLATLILLSYGNFLQTSLIILSPSLLLHVSSDETRREVVWLLDGHLPYFTGKHIPLCIVAIVILILAIGYKVLIFSWQWMIRCPNKPLLKWINNHKLNAFIKTYQAPYHDEHRYWTGLLLLVRVLLTIVLISTGSTNPDDSVLFMIVVLGILFLLKMSYAKNLYKNWAVDALETVLLFNLFVLTTVTYFSDSDLVTIVLAYTSTMLTLLLLFITITCHFYAYIVRPKLRKSEGNVKRTIKVNEPNPHANVTNDDDDNEDRFREVLGSFGTELQNVADLTPPSLEATLTSTTPNLCPKPKAVTSTVLELSAIQRERR